MQLNGFHRFRLGLGGFGFALLPAAEQPGKESIRFRLRFGRLFRCGYRFLFLTDPHDKLIDRLIQKPACRNQHSQCRSGGSQLEKRRRGHTAPVNIVIAFYFTLFPKHLAHSLRRGIRR